ACWMARTCTQPRQFNQQFDSSLPQTQGVAMTALGFNESLYILPFDHRKSFQTKMFGWSGTLSPERTAEIAATKQVIYDGFEAAVKAGVPKQKAGILVDEQFGAAILRDATAHSYTSACPAENSGQEAFDLEYFEEVALNIEAFNPTFCKVLVRYNPEGDRALNRRQAARLRRLSEYLHNDCRSRFMFELLVPPENADVDQIKGDHEGDSMEIRRPLRIQNRQAH